MENEVFDEFVGDPCRREGRKREIRWMEREYARFFGIKSLGDARGEVGGNTDKWPLFGVSPAEGPGIEFILKVGGEIP